MSSKNLSPIILALDVDTKKEALEWVDRFSKQIDIFKVGLQLFSKEGISMVDEIISRGKKVFVDLKLHDIPNTVGQAVRVLSRPGVEFITIHASGGAKMISAASTAVSEACKKQPAISTKILSVTILTSLDDNDIRAVGFNRSTKDQVTLLADLARKSGSHGIVCSPHEIEPLRAAHGKDLVIVTPGVRMQAGKVHDQKRIMTPIEALRLGSDYLVMGRSLVEADNPETMIQGVLDEAGLLQS